MYLKWHFSHLNNQSATTLISKQCVFDSLKIIDSELFISGIQSTTLTALYGCVRKLRLTWCLAALSSNDFAGSVFARRYLMKLISDGLLRQRNGLMFYNKIEQVLVITKWIFNYYNTDFSLEMTSKVQKVSQKYTFTHKLTTKRNFQTPSLFLCSTITAWNAQDCAISKAAKDTSMLPSGFDQKKVPPETGSEAEFRFGRVLMPSCLGMLPPNAAF